MSARKTVRVSVLHGDLRASRFPVLVGHYQGDVIASAEAHLDSALGGRLTRSHGLRLYPGPNDTSEVFLRSGAQEKGLEALVVGLGQVGDLTTGKLSRGVTRVVLQYATTRLTEARSGEELSLGISAVLVGTNAGGVSITDSLYAILEGVRRANAALVEARLPVLVDAVELVELWQDRALIAQDRFRVLATDPDLQGAFRFEPTLRSHESGQRRLWFEESTQGWWQRVQILGEPSADAPDGSLRFTTLTERARSELRVLPTQRALVDRFIERAVSGTTYSPEVSRTLYELLFPNALKERAPDRADLVLLLDEAAAAYPWELLEDRASTDRRPFAVERGVVRQLSTLTMREHVATATQSRALVIGDTRSGLAPLPGAREEAELARRALSASRFETDHLIAESAATIVRALYAKEYRVLHLAGHGVFEHELDASPTKVTGLVLGDDAFLTAAEVEQMRQVPELVFVNCCYLGRTKSPDAGRDGRHDYHRLAAGFSSQLIRMGVRAVVAAGWALDDAAAKTFATRAYACLLEGRTFGEAVKEARVATFEGHPDSNAWGAYQCYGDPGYLLVRDGEAQRRTASVRFYSPAHAVNALENRTRALLLARRPTAPLLDLPAIERGLVDEGWLNHAEVASALGAAFDATGQHEHAAELLSKALRAHDGEARLKDVEALVQALCSAATRVAELERALALLDWLSPEPANAWTTRTSGRLALRARLHERLSELGAEGDHEALAARAYEAANETPESRGEPYLRARSLLLTWLRSRVAGAEVNLDAAREEVSELLRTSSATDFESAAALAHASLLACLLGLPPHVSFEELCSRYQAARACATPRSESELLREVRALRDRARRLSKSDDGLELLGRLVQHWGLDRSHDASS